MTRSDLRTLLRHRLAPSWPLHPLAPPTTTTTWHSHRVSDSSKNRSLLPPLPRRAHRCTSKLHRIQGPVGLCWMFKQRSLWLGSTLHVLQRIKRGHVNNLSGAREWRCSGASGCFRLGARQGLVDGGCASERCRRINTCPFSFLDGD